MLARLLPAVLALLMANSSSALAQDSDEAAIQNLQSKQAAAWNAHDPSAYAVAHVRWTMKGALAPSGGAAPPQQGIQLQVLVRSQDGWRIASLQNTNSIPERPFPRVRPATP